MLDNRRDPRELAAPAAPDRALGYALYLLRTVRFEGALGEDPYLRSLGAERESLPQALKRVPGLAYHRLGQVEDIEWQYPSLSAWGMQVLRGEA